MKQRILSMLLVLCLLAALLPQVVPTASAAIRYGECGDYDSDVRWVLDTETGVLTISGTGAMDSPGWSAYKDSIVTVIVEDGVTSVSWYAFYGYPNLTSVTLAESVARVEQYAFVDCAKLESVTVLNPTCRMGDNYDPAFGTFGVPAVTTTFYGYKGSTTEVYGKANGRFVALPDNPAYTDLTWEFEETSGVLSISGTGAMRDYYEDYYRAPWQKHSSAIQKVVVGEGVTYIGENAFYECTALTEVSLPSTLTSIGDYAFYGCTALTEITLPESVEQFDRYAFQDCTALETITILSPKAYCSDVYGPYLGVAGQTVIRGHIPSVVQSYTQYGYTFEPICAHIYDETACTLCGADRYHRGERYDEVWTLDLVTGHLVLAPSTDIDEDDEFVDFGYCQTEIRSLEVKDGITYLGPYAFYDYESLISIHLAQSVKSIEEGAFFSCSNLKSATILNPNINFAGPYRLPFSGSAEGFVFHAHEGSNTQIFAEDYGFGFEALPDSLPTGQVTWSFDEESGVLTISGNGRMPDYRDCEGLPWFDLLEQIKEVVIEDGITHIGSSAFSVCTAMKSVSIPDSVTSIGSSAFAYCDLLQSVVLPDGLTKIPACLFMYCTSLTSVNIPEGVTSIGAYAFADCPLQSIDIPDSVETIYWGVFSGCKELTEVVLPDGLTVLEEGIFYGCSSLQKVTIPDSVTEIKESAFSSCTALESIAIPESVTELAYSVFSDCSSLQSVSIPESVTELAYGVFSDCDSLADITIPDSVRSIGERAFYGCDKLESVSIPNSVTEIGESAFSECPLTTVTIPESVTYVGSNAFYNCTALESVYVLNPECFVSTDAKTLGSSEQTVIYAQGGSLAESYAEMNGYRFYHICTCGGYDCVFEETEIAPTCGKSGSTKMICVDCGYPTPSRKSLQRASIAMN